MSSIHLSPLAPVRHGGGMRRMRPPSRGCCYLPLPAPLPSGRQQDEGFVMHQMPHRLDVARNRSGGDENEWPRERPQTWGRFPTTTRTVLVIRGKCLRRPNVVLQAHS
ncbi:hypothetical protein PFLUV_G00254980 [Perca fluviatilis]|uniref:Uncharacterized protein n=1 Tax=Perca fluviatilis TaxID=8168 RepID=A0A6A5DP44_PERFL|nr:hypothetical protein PFLUV_G00254980 [Perca fluviatilis]